MGLDSLKPYKRASNSWRMDVKGIVINNALILSHNMLLLPSFAHTVLEQGATQLLILVHQEHQIVSMANTTERCCVPCP